MSFLQSTSNNTHRQVMSGEAFLVDTIDNALERNTAKRLSDFTNAVISTLKDSMS